MNAVEAMGGRFYKIGRYSNWCDIDCYGKPEEDGPCSIKNEIKDKDYIQVHWPNKSVEPYTVIVKLSKETVCDMGHDYDMQVSIAYITLTYKGAKLEVRLRDIKGITIRPYVDEERL